MDGLRHSDISHTQLYCFHLLLEVDYKLKHTCPASSENIQVLKLWLKSIIWEQSIDLRQVKLDHFQNLHPRLQAQHTKMYWGCGDSIAHQKAWHGQLLYEKSQPLQSWNQSVHFGSGHDILMLIQITVQSSKLAQQYPLKIELNSARYDIKYMTVFLEGMDTHITCITQREREV